MMWFMVGNNEGRIFCGYSGYGDLTVFPSSRGEPFELSVQWWLNPAGVEILLAAK